MKYSSINIDLKFDQILDLVKQLPRKEKLKLTRELEKEIVFNKLNALLKAFKTDELDEEVINQEVKIVRKKLYEAKSAKDSH